jgi:hypothetical protein
MVAGAPRLQRGGRDMAHRGWQLGNDEGSRGVMTRHGAGSSAREWQFGTWHVAGQNKAAVQLLLFEIHFS